MPKYYNLYSGKWGSKKTNITSKKAVDRRQDKQIAKISKELRFGRDRKYIDQYAQTSVGTIWTPLTPRPLTYITQGHGNQQRQGNSCQVHSVRLKGFIAIDDTTNRVRIMVVRFGRVDSASIAIGDFLAQGLTASPQHLLSMATRNGDVPYNVLMDKTIILSGNGSANSSVGVLTHKYFDYKIPIKGKKRACFYTQDADTLPSDGFIYIIASSDSLLGGVTLNLQTRMIFSG